MAYNTNIKQIGLPCIVTMTRISPRFLDEEDNLRMAFKWIKDEISECIFPEKRKSYVTTKGKIRHIKGRADSDARITWKYAQEKSPTQEIRIEFEW